MDYGRKFVYFQDRYRKPDGRKFKHKDIERETNGYVSAAYISNLKQGHNENPSYDRLCAIAEVMGFPPELWYQRDVGTEEQEINPEALATLAHLDSETIASLRDEETKAVLNDFCHIKREEDRRLVRSLIGRLSGSHQ